MVKKGIIDKTAEIASTSRISDSANVWQFAHIREGAVIGENVVIGRGVYIGPGVVVGGNSKIQNYALIYEPAVLETGVFIGPAVVLTNDKLPRATNPDLSQKLISDWQSQGVHIKTGASIGANATCIGPITVGKWALIGAGSVVTKDVPDFALMAGNPARRVGWVGPAGVRLTYETHSGKYVCPSTGSKFLLLETEILAEQEI